MFKAAWIVLFALLLGCNPSPPPKAKTPVTPAAAPAVSEVRADTEGLMFRYRAEGDVWSPAETIEAVPAAARSAVQVVDLSRAPAERGAGRWVQLTDLRSPAADGRYPSRMVALDDLEAELVKKAAEAPKQRPVIMYSAAWCGVCKKAARFLDENKIAYTEKDIEKDPKAANELKAKAQKAGVQVGGVPVFDVGGKILPGFDPNTLLSAARGS